ncbi:MAG: hypothetical protein CR984_03025 [Proteobacteria bacterium]|nr:MAG: hypothetical protein CR984_03025 [Pseudomonadota bacterium]
MNNRYMFVLVIALAGLFAMIDGAGAANIHVAEATVCQEIVERTPVGVSEVIPAGTEQILCFTRIQGAVGETDITHNWYYQGSLKASVKLPVRSTDWRTWSYKTVAPEWTGEWMVEVLASDGTPLESIIFFVQ